MTAYPSFDEVFTATFLTAVGKETVVNSSLSQSPEYTAKAVTETVSSTTQHIQFHSGSTQLTSEGVRQCTVLANKVKVSKLVVTVIGHADRHGTAAQNLELSKRRAEAVVAFFVSKNMDPNKFRIEYVGDKEATNDDAASRKVVIEFNK
jgi:outer membrane protein OmpA-like peptidoglycan-associated protein